MKKQALGIIAIIMVICQFNQRISYAQQVILIPSSQKKLSTAQTSKQVNDNIKSCVFKVKVAGSSNFYQIFIRLAKNPATNKYTDVVSITSHGLGNPLWTYHLVEDSKLIAADQTIIISVYGTMAWHIVSENFATFYQSSEDWELKISTESGLIKSYTKLNKLKSGTMEKADNEVTVRDDNILYTIVPIAGTLLIIFLIYITYRIIRKYLKN